MGGEEKVVIKVKEKKEEIITAVYKLNLHCPECAEAVEKHIVRHSGVHKVEADIESQKVTVKGKFDVKTVHELIEKKSRRRVELISPKPKKEEIREKKVEKKKEVIKTITVKVHMHCDSCEYDLKWIIMKHKDVHSVTTNRGAGTCTVVGVIEEKTLTEYIRKKTRKHCEVVVQKKEKVTVVEEIKVVEKDEEVKITEVFVPYFIHCTHPPQCYECFSDENPYACYVM